VDLVMDLPQFLRRQTFGSEPPRAPRVLLYIPPSGSPVHCPDAESAKVAAENFAAENPGRTVAVYQLIGYAFRPIEKPEFTPAESEKAAAELLDAVPSTVDLGNDGELDDDAEIEAPHLSPEQRETLERLRRATRGDPV
jgi:hypothetical protein